MSPLSFALFLINILFQYSVQKTIENTLCTIRYIAGEAASKQQITFYVFGRFHTESILDNLLNHLGSYHR